MSLYIVNVFWIVSDKSLSFHFFIVKNFNQEISYLTSFIKLSLFYANNVQIQKFFIKKINLIKLIFNLNSST